MLESNYCTDCEAAMRIVREGSARRYQCLRCGANGAVIGPNVRLGFSEIYNDMLRSNHVDASLESMRQALYRRLSYELNHFETGRRYLSAPEIETLKRAGDIVERLAYAAEQAKLAKRVQEDAREQKMQLRYRLAQQRLRELVHGDDPINILIDVLVLSERNREAIPPYEAATIVHLSALAPANGVTRFMRDELHGRLEDEIDMLAHSIAAASVSRGDFDDQLCTVEGYLDDARAQVQRSHSLTIDALLNAIALERYTDQPKENR